MKSLRGWIAGAIGVLVVVGCLAVVPGSASAIIYCAIPVPSSSPCAQYVDGRWSQNTVHYQGAGSIGVCEKTLLLSSDPYINGHQVSRNCANNLVRSGAADSWSWLGYQERFFAINNSQWTHTLAASADPYGIWGYRAAGGSSTGASNGTEFTGESIAPSALPKAIRAKLGVLRDAPSDGRIATVVRPDDQVSLRTTERMLCLSSEQAGGEITCQHNDLATEGQLLAATICGDDLPPENVVLFGVVPDGVSAVDVVNASGASLGEGVVARNTFRVPLAKVAAAEATAVQWTGKKGAVSLAEILPEDLSC